MDPPVLARLLLTTLLVRGLGTTLMEIPEEPSPTSTNELLTTDVSS